MNLLISNPHCANNSIDSVDIAAADAQVNDVVGNQHDTYQLTENTCYQTVEKQISYKILNIRDKITDQLWT